MRSSRRFPRLTRSAGRTAAIFGAVVTIVAGLSAAPVAAQKGGGGSTETREQNAVFAACDISWSVNGNQNCNLYDVPAGKRLVIQHASLACSSPTGYPASQAFVGGMLSGTTWTPNGTFIPLVAQPMPGGYPDQRQTGSIALTAYADPGSPVRAQAWGYIGAYCFTTMSGYLVTMP